MDTLGGFSVIFTKGHNFRDLLFTTLYAKSRWKWGLSERKEFAPQEQILPFQSRHQIASDSKIFSKELSLLKGYPFLEYVLYNSTQKYI